MKHLRLLLILSLTAGLTCACSAANGPGRQNAVTDEELLENAEKARIANPWGETQSISVAGQWAGVDFKPPSEDITLEDGRDVSLTTYRYMTGTAEALYRSDDNELTFRQSCDTEGVSLTGDHNAYSHEWDERIDEVDVHCFGDGKTINLAYYDDRNDHFSITFDCGEEGKGLTADDLMHIISSEQDEENS